MQFSPEVLRFLDSILATVTLNVGADDFEEMAVVVAKAKREVRDALVAPTGEPD